MVPRHNVYLIIALTIFAMIAPVSAYATTSGLDTPTGSSDLPFAIQGTQVMDLTATGLGIGTTAPLAALDVRTGTNQRLLLRGPITDTASTTGTSIGSVNDINNAWEPLELDGSVTIMGMEGVVGIGGIPGGSWELEVHGAAGLNGIFGQPTSAANWGVGGYSQDGNSYGGLGVANAYGVYGVSNNDGVYGINTSGDAWGGVFTGPNFGVFASGAVWAGEFAGPVAITSGYLQFPDGTRQTTAATSRFGGGYGQAGNGACVQVNGFTGGCSCPSGTSAHGISNSTFGGVPYNSYLCY
jgi:hypothetical protein